MNKLKKYYNKRGEAKKYIIWLVRLIRPWLPIIIVISLVNGLSSLIGVGVSVINKYVVDAATANEPYFNTVCFAALAGVMLFNLLFNNALNVGKTLLNERFAFSLKERFYERIMSAKWLELSRIHSGDVMTRLTGDVDTVASGMFSVIPSMSYIVFQLVAAFSVLYYYDPKLALFALALGPAGLIISVVMSRVYARFQRQSRENESAYRAFLQESIGNLVIAKSFSREEANKARMREFWKIRYNIMKKRSLTSMGIGVCMGVIFNGGYLIAFGWSLMRLVRGEITYGTVTLLLTLVSQVRTPISNLQSLLQQLISIVVSAGRIMEIWDMPSESYEEDAWETDDLELGVRADHIRFAYEAGHEAVLKDLSFDIHPGEVVGIVGVSGAGKTTIIRMLLSLIEPEKGSLCVYDTSGNIRKISPSTRKLISYVPQGNTLMSGSIRENLLVGKDDATEEEMWRALSIAEAEGFVKELPLGLDSKILEKGGAVSEGQAQRIAIARAIIKPAPILILDEATASLDIQTEADIVKNLKEHCENQTCIVVTHRPSLLDICERTLELADGVLGDVSR